MAEFITKSANLRLTDADKKSVCSVNDVSPSVPAETAAAFVEAVETLFNGGPCTAQMRVVYDLKTA